MKGKILPIIFIAVVLAFLVIVVPRSNDVHQVSESKYRIINADRQLPYKIAVDVRLKQKVSVDELSLYAHQIAQQFQQGQERLFITYYLPEMAVGKGAWAISHFTPELEIKVLGSPLGVNEDYTPQPNTMGVWEDPSPLIAFWELYLHDNELVLKVTFRDESVAQYFVKQNSTERGKELRRIEPSPDYWLINRQGNLESHDNFGLINVAKRVNAAKD